MTGTVRANVPLVLATIYEIHASKNSRDRAKSLRKMEGKMKEIDRKDESDWPWRIKTIKKPENI